MRDDGNVEMKGTATKAAQWETILTDELRDYLLARLVAHGHIVKQYVDWKKDVK